MRRRLMAGAWVLAAALSACSGGDGDRVVSVEVPAAAADERPPTPVRMEVCGLHTVCVEDGSGALGAVNVRVLSGVNSLDGLGGTLLFDAASGLQRRCPPAVDVVSGDQRLIGGAVALYFAAVDVDGAELERSVGVLRLTPSGAVQVVASWQSEGCGTTAGSVSSPSALDVVADAVATMDADRLGRLAGSATVRDLEGVVPDSRPL